MSAEKVLVTGGAGFVGSHVADVLLNRGYEITLLDDLSGGFLENVPDGCRFVNGSVCDVDLVDTLFRRTKFDYVYHLAAYAPEALSHFIRRFNYQNNVLGSINVINASIRTDVKQFVFASSVAVYGKDSQSVSEASPTQPIDPYGVAKLAIEHDLRAAEDMFGLPFTIFRPHNIYGPRQSLVDQFRNVVGIFVKSALRGEPMPIFGDGSQTRAFSFIEDVAPIIASAVRTPAATGQVFNIGGDSSYSVLELAEEVARAAQVEANIEYLDARNEAQHVSAKHEQLIAVFGERMQTSLADGIRRTVEWASERGIGEGKLFKPSVDLVQNMPSRYRDALGIAGKDSVVPLSYGRANAERSA